MSIREMFEKKAGVIAAYPHGDTKKLFVRLSKAGAVTEEESKKLVASDRRFKVLSFKKKSLVRKKKKAKSRPTPKS